MKTLIFASNSSLHFSKHSQSKSKFPIFQPKTSKKFNYQLTTLKPQASAKGFSNTRKPSSTNKKNNEITIMKNPYKKNNEEEDELPKVVMYRIIGRILFSVLVPMALGLSFLHLYGELKEREIWDGPLWVPFMTTLITFGASSLGIAYGVLSSSLDAEREGTLLGFQEIEKNWDEMWQQEDVYFPSMFEALNHHEQRLSLAKEVVLFCPFRAIVSLLYVDDMIIIGDDSWI